MMKRCLTCSHLRWYKFLVYLPFLELNMHLIIFKLEIPDDLGLKFVGFLKMMLSISKFEMIHQK